MNDIIWYYVMYIILYQCILYNNRLTYSQIIKGSLEVKLPTIWTVEQPPSVRQKRCVPVNDRKCAKWCVLPWILRPDDPKGRLAKAAGAEPFGGRAAKHGTPPAREAHLEVKIVKTLRSRNTFGRCNFQKWHAANARSTFASQNRQNATVSEHFWKMQLPNMARRLRAKHIWKSKSSKHYGLGALFKMQLQTMARRQRAKHICKSKSSKPYGLGALFQDATLKNGTSPAHEAHLEVKSVKAHR